MSMADSKMTKYYGQEFVVFSKVWEDCRLLAKGLQIQHQDHVLTITGAGDSVLDLLLEEPRKITTVDISMAQNAVLELKVAGIKHLQHAQFVRLLGDSPSSKEERLALFSSIKGKLPEYAKTFWESHIGLIGDDPGLSFAGKIDNSILACKWNEVIGDEAVENFFTASSLEEQREVFDSWPTDKLKKQFGLIFDPARRHKGGNPMLKFMLRSDDEVEADLWERFVHCCTQVPAKDNFYLSWYLRGRAGYDPLVRPDFCPLYLQEVAFGKIKNLVDRVNIVTSSVEEYLPTVKEATFDKVNLSNIMDVMPKGEKLADLFKLVASKCKGGARIAHWGMLDPNPCPRKLEEEGLLVPLSDLATELFQQDRFFYVAFHLNEIPQK